MKQNKILLGFKHALDGLAHAAKTQTNLQVHLLAALGVILLGWYVQLNRLEWLIICFTILLVLVAELANTAIESVTDLITIKFSQHAKTAKDVAAGMVLVSAIGAVIIGLIIFYPYLVSR